MLTEDRRWQWRPRGARVVHDTARERYCARMRLPITPLPLLVAFAALSGPSAAHAQAPWRGTAEVSGNFLYGAASQRVFAAAAGTQHDSPRVQFRLDLNFGYGDSRLPETGERRVIVRNTRLSSSVDLNPRHTVSPFSFGAAETSLQQRIAGRISAGAGAKWTIWRPDSVVDGFREESSLSGALLVEETRALVLASAADESRGAGTRYRWSVRARYRKRIGNALRLSHESLYQPTVSHPGRYTLVATSVVSVPVRARTEFTLTHRERLDSEATDRGAPSIRDGQVLFGIRATF